MTFWNRSDTGASCQRDDIVGEHGVLVQIRGRVRAGLGIKSAVLQLVKPPPPRPRLGKPSAFAIGTWVRVKPEPALRATLDTHGCTRGLSFTGSQWSTIGGVYRVASHVRRLRDDRGRFRPVSRTVLLEHVDCAPSGCGRNCPMMYRDEWLEPAEPPPSSTTHPVLGHARVRDLAEILPGLDRHGRRDGVTFTLEMRGHAGKRFAIADRIARVLEYDRRVPTRAPIYILEGVHCGGAIAGARGPCDRACALMWHADWLEIE